MGKVFGALAIVMLVGGCSGPSAPGMTSPTSVVSPRSAPASESADRSPPTGTGSDGLAIALVSDAEGGAGIYLAGPDGRRERLSPTADPAVLDFAPVWSPAGDRLAYQRITTEGVAAIYVADAVHGGEQQVAIIGPPSTSDSRTSWSPDGTRLAFWSTTGTDNEIRIVNLSDGAVATVSTDSGTDRYPAWSPSSEVLAFWSDRSGRGAIWLVSSDGSGLRQLVEVGAAYGPIDWAPDGRSIAVAVEKPGSEWLIRVVDVDGATQAEFEQDGSALGPAWSPDGTRLAYIQLIGQARQLWVADISDGTEERIGPSAAVGLISTASHVGDRWPSPPSWSPDGEAIAAEWVRSSGLEVIVVVLDDESWFSLTPSEANDGSPTWRPDPGP